LYFPCLAYFESYYLSFLCRTGQAKNEAS
jgi:hypothetical protein